jgi:subtilisin family serine protease
MKTFIFKFYYVCIIVSVFLAGCSKDPAVSAKKDFRLNEEIHLAPMMEKQPGGKYIDGAYIVVLNDDVEEAEVDGECDRICNQRKSKKNRSFKYALKGFSVNLTAQEIEEVRKDSKVKFIEQDQVATAVATQTPATWGLDRLDQPTLPLSGSYTYDKNGSTVDAYIFDSGIKLDHVEFTGRVLSGYNAITLGALANDDNGHGSHVAGTVGGTTYGVAKGIRLIAVKVLNNLGSGTFSQIIAGIDWAIAHHGTKPAVGNMSLGGVGTSPTLEAAVRRAITDGIVMCLAAGNSILDASGFTPARTAEAITVGATTSTDGFASYSNFGAVVDILAPGSAITSAWFASSTAINTISGTSMASPHVAGVAALYLENNPGATTAQVETALKNSAVSGAITGLPAGTGNRLLQSSFTPPPPPTVVPAAPAQVSPANAATGVSLTANLSWNASATATSYAVQVSTDQNFATTVINRTGITTTSSALSGLTNGTVYYWRVNATNVVGASTWSATRSFTTVFSAPGLLSPANAATNVSRTPTLTWSAAAGATTYNVEYSTSSTFAAGTATVTRTGVAGPSLNITPALLSRTRYFWRVQSVRGTVTSAYSGSISFTTTR